MALTPRKIRQRTILLPSMHPGNQDLDLVFQNLNDILHELEEIKLETTQIAVTGSASGDILVADADLVYRPQKYVPNSLGVGENLTVSGNALVSGTASIVGATSISGNAAISGNVGVSGGISISGAATVSGSLIHKGSQVGLNNVAPVAQDTGYTQTYATAEKVHAARTAAALTDNVAGGVGTTLAAIPDPGDAPATVDALRDDIVTNVLPKIRDALSSLADQVNKARTDALDTAQVLNALIDYLQLRGDIA
jgi:hypothetical protein